MTAETTPRKRLRAVVSYPPETVLTIEQLAEALQCSVSTVERADIPCTYVGSLRRYVWRQVLAYLEAKAA